jgi:hypothetical protein
MRLSGSGFVRRQGEIDDAHDLIIVVAAVVVPKGTVVGDSLRPLHGQVWSHGLTLNLSPGEDCSSITADMSAANAFRTMGWTWTR